MSTTSRKTKKKLWRPLTRHSNIHDSGSTALCRTLLQCPVLIPPRAVPRYAVSVTGWRTPKKPSQISQWGSSKLNWRPCHPAFITQLFRNNKASAPKETQKGIVKGQQKWTPCLDSGFTPLPFSPGAHTVRITEHRCAQFCIQKAKARMTKWEKPGIKTQNNNN